MLRISPRTLWGLTARGEVPAVKIGKSKRYDRRDLAAFVDRLRGQTATPATAEATKSATNANGRPR